MFAGIFGLIVAFIARLAFTPFIPEWLTDFYHGQTSVYLISNLNYLVFNRAIEISQSFWDGGSSKN